MRPLLLDLFCGAGGAARGYHDAGFDVVGVDVEPMPNYPYEFHKGDALTLGADLLAAGAFDAVHASPPCQGYSQMSACRPGLAGDYQQLVTVVRERLRATGLPYVIENVDHSGVAAQPDLYGANGLMLCGAMFGLRTYRHRFFESSIPLTARDHPRHLVPSSPAGHWKPGTFISVAGGGGHTDLKREAMGIDWMTRDELSEAIPPAYTRLIGKQLLSSIGVTA